MIEVEISEYEANKFDHDTLLGVALMKALKEAGVPVMGKSFVLRGVERGTLTYRNDEDMNGIAHVFRWCEDQDDRKTGTPLRVKVSTGVCRKWGRHAVLPEDDEL